MLYLQFLSFHVELEVGTQSSVLGLAIEERTHNFNLIKVLNVLTLGLYLNYWFNKNSTYLSPVSIHLTSVKFKYAMVKKCFIVEMQFTTIEKFSKLV